MNNNYFKILFSLKTLCCLSGLTISTHISLASKEALGRYGALIDNQAILTLADNLDQSVQTIQINGQVHQVQPYVLLYPDKTPTRFGLWLLKTPVTQIKSIDRDYDCSLKESGTLHYVKSDGLAKTKMSTALEFKNECEKGSVSGDYQSINLNDIQLDGSGVAIANNINKDKLKLIGLSYSTSMNNTVSRSTDNPHPISRLTPEINDIINNVLLKYSLGTLQIPEIKQIAKTAKAKVRSIESYTNSQLGVSLEHESTTSTAKRSILAHFIDPSAALVVESSIAINDQMTFQNETANVSAILNIANSRLKLICLDLASLSSGGVQKACLRDLLKSDSANVDVQMKGENNFTSHEISSSDLSSSSTTLSLFDTDVQYKAGDGVYYQSNGARYLVGLVSNASDSDLTIQWITHEMIDQFHSATLRHSLGQSIQTEPVETAKTKPEEVKPKATTPESPRPKTAPNSSSSSSTPKPNQPSPSEKPKIATPKSNTKQRGNEIDLKKFNVAELPSNQIKEKALLLIDNRLVISHQNALNNVQIGDKDFSSIADFALPALAGGPDDSIYLHVLSDTALDQNDNHHAKYYRFDSIKELKRKNLCIFGHIEPAKNTPKRFEFRLDNLTDDIICNLTVPDTAGTIIYFPAGVYVYDKDQYDLAGVFYKDSNKNNKILWFTNQIQQEIQKKQSEILTH